MNRQIDRWTDNVIPLNPPNFVWGGGGYKNALRSAESIRLGQVTVNRWVFFYFGLMNLLHVNFLPFFSLRPPPLSSCPSKAAPLLLGKGGGRP